MPSYSATGTATGYTSPSGFTNAEGVAYNPANNTLYAADSSNNQIRTFNAATDAETQIGFATAGINQPYGLALNAGVLYVGKASAIIGTSYNDRIRVLTRWTHRLCRPSSACTAPA